MTSTGKPLVQAMLGAFLLAGCQMTKAEAPAVLITADTQTMTELKAVLAGAMKTASVEIGPGDVTQTSTISVLPPRLSPLEGRSTATPVQFDIIKKGRDCSVIRRDTGEVFSLGDIACRVAGE